MSYTDIDKPEDYFNTKLYTGNGTTDYAITGVGFQPDFFWGKKRSASGSHFLVNNISGVGKHLHSDYNGAETTFAEGVKSFDSDGVTIGTAGDINTNGATHVAWNWLASNTTASNTQGDITSTVSANTTSGFSIVSYTGTGSTATIGHSLNSAPAMIIIKNRSSTENWIVYHSSEGATKHLKLNTTDASATSSGTFNNTEPTSSVFTVNTNTNTNANGSNMIAYCFAEKKGFSKFGSYTGNGNADGTFVYTGFKPAVVICKKSSASGTNWGIIDNKRANSFNEISAMLNPNSSGTEGANNNCDFVSNGFKWRSSDGNSNTSGDTFIYMAFASEPFTTSTGIPCTAR